MTFEQGQSVIHPFLGPARVESTLVRDLPGGAVEYVQLMVLATGMQVGIPVAKAKELGVRPVSSPERIEELMDVLRAPSEEASAQWSQRVKALRERLATGRIDDVCVVVRDISRQEKAPSTSEQGILRDATERLALEVSLGLGIDVDEATKQINEAAVGDPAGAVTA